MNAPFSRLPRSAPQPVPSSFAPTLPMEALADPGAGHPGWQDTWPLHAQAASRATAASPTAAEAPASRPIPDMDALESDFHEPLGGLQMRELESPELFEHLFGPGTAA